jgi:hypothetical protein
MQYPTGSRVELVRFRGKTLLNYRPARQYACTHDTRGCLGIPLRKKQQKEIMYAGAGTKTGLGRKQKLCWVTLRSVV